jgi:hypothetical protein
MVGIEYTNRLVDRLTCIDPMLLGSRRDQPCSILVVVGVHAEVSRILVVWCHAWRLGGSENGLQAGPAHGCWPAPRCLMNGAQISRQQRGESARCGQSTRWPSWELLVAKVGLLAASVLNLHPPFIRPSRPPSSFQSFFSISCMYSAGTQSTCRVSTKIQCIPSQPATCEAPCHRPAGHRLLLDPL